MLCASTSTVDQYEERLKTANKVDYVDMEEELMAESCFLTNNNGINKSFVQELFLNGPGNNLEQCQEGIRAFRVLTKISVVQDCLPCSADLKNIHSGVKVDVKHCRMMIALHVHYLRFA